MTLATSPPRCAYLAFLAVFEVTGDDRQRWLQGQVTADVFDARRSQGLHGFHLDAQGKIRAELRFVEHPDRTLVVVDGELRSALLADLDRRIVMEDVTLTARDDLAVIGVYGTGVEDLLPAMATGFTTTSDRFGPSGYEVGVPVDELESRLAALVAGCAALGGGGASLAELDALRVRWAMPRHGIDFGPSSLPQETGLHLRTVSFTKGCYVGQEPVVMIEHRGKPPRRAVLLRFEGQVPSPPFEITNGEGVVVGRCTSTTSDPDGPLGLATLKRSAAESDLELTAGATRALRVRFVGDPA